MGRTAGSIGTGGENSFPPPGKYNCKCTKIDKFTANNKKAIKLTWKTDCGMYAFEDSTFLVSGAMKRLNLIAQKVCGMPETQELDDDDAICCKELADIIARSVVGKMATVTVIEKDEEYMDEETNRMKTVKRQSVPFTGYDKPTHSESESTATPKEGEDIPW